MNEFLTRLKVKDRRGSKPRCLSLVDGSREEVASKLTDLAAGWCHVRPSDKWLPNTDSIKEAQLDKPSDLLPEKERQELSRWWLGTASSSRRTPNWDIASTCEVEGRSGLLLVEAKAHLNELEDSGKRCGLLQSTSSRKNHEQIKRAVQEAAQALGWPLTCSSHYQMTNRLAWSWKLASLGRPVVLVFLGFLHATEMFGVRGSIISEADWQERVASHHPDVPKHIWGRAIDVSGTPFIPLAIARHVVLPAPERALPGE